MKNSLHRFCKRVLLELPATITHLASPVRSVFDSIAAVAAAISFSFAATRASPDICAPIVIEKTFSTVGKRMQASGSRSYSTIAFLVRKKSMAPTFGIPETRLRRGKGRETDNGMM